MKVLLAHPGTQYSHQLARQLYRQNCLYFFYTGLAFGKDSLFYTICSKLPKRIFSKVSNRFVDEVPDKLIKRRVRNELISIMKLKFVKDHEGIIFKRNLKFQQSISFKDITAADAVIGFDTSSWYLADVCKRSAVPFFLDVSIAHPVAKEKIYEQINHLYPESDFNLKKKRQQFLDNEADEIEKADHIVVASSFTLNTYIQQGIPADKISVNPYGVDSTKFSPRADKKISDKIRLVFVGVLDARKGVHFLLDAWRSIDKNNIELTLIGPVSTTIRSYINQNFPDVIVTGKRSFNEMQELLTGYDVLVFPSFFEGFGLVIPEAMASGLPVITTTATCGPDVISNSIEGFIIELGNKDMLINSINYFIQDPEQIQTMGKRATAKAKKLSWSSYGKEWIRIINTYIKS